MNTLRIQPSFFALTLASLTLGAALYAPRGYAQSAAPSAAPSAPPAASASAAPTAAFAGTWRLSTAGAEGVVFAAIDRAISGMGFLAEPIARGRLRGRARAYAWVRFEPAGNELAITLEGRPTTRGPTDGSARQGTNPEGETYTVTVRAEPSRIVQEFRLEQGGRRIAYVLNADGALELHVRMFSDRLPRPVEYTLTYRR